MRRFGKANAGLSYHLAEAGRLVTLGFLLPVKLPLQWLGVLKRPEILAASIHGHRYPVYLLVALASEYQVEFFLKDIGFFYRFLPLRDFFWRTTILLPGQKSRAPVAINWEGREPVVGKTPIRIDSNFYAALPQAGAHLVMPYFAYPDFYGARLQFRAASFQPGPRRHRIFFCGSAEEELYTTQFRFPMLNRFQIVDCILKNFPDQIARSMAGPEKPLKLILSEDKTKEKYPLSVAGFYAILTRSDFFLSPPGWVMPHSHNIIEAMTAGAIPITNYGHLFYPPLRDGIDCLAFTSLDDLVEVIQRAIAMPTPEVEELRRGVIAYYRDHLQPSAFAAAFRKNWSLSTTLLVNAERELEAAIRQSAC
jgi:hypothetical protein